jgi:hypothetical protein
MKVEDATIHGFRSSFRDWAGNVSNFPREITETVGHAPLKRGKGGQAIARASCKMA